jgi:hypothetical protein
MQQASRVDEMSYLTPIVSSFERYQPGPDVKVGNDRWIRSSLGIPREVETREVITIDIGAGYSCPDGTRARKWFFDERIMNGTSPLASNSPLRAKLGENAFTRTPNGFKTEAFAVDTEHLREALEELRGLFYVFPVHNARPYAWKSGGDEAGRTTPFPDGNLMNIHIRHFRPIDPETGNAISNDIWMEGRLATFNQEHMERGLQEFIRLSGRGQFSEPHGRQRPTLSTVVSSSSSVANWSAALEQSPIGFR